MKILSGYHMSDDDNLINIQYDIAINSCGRYQLISKKEIKTSRPYGRADFQLIYIAKGKGTFIINGKENMVNEGSLVVYFPGESQYYTYYGSDAPVIYWIHFSGFNALNYLKHIRIEHSGIYYFGMKNELIIIFNKIIKELQIKQLNYFEMCNLYTKEVITLISRNLTEFKETTYKKNKLITYALEYFNDNFNTAINIKEYADNCNISCCWFIRSFKEYIGTTPIQYITNIRINKAKSLLSSSSLSVSEISDLIGYENPLYFSRIFKKNVGVSPLAYRHNESKLL